jgi:hypothetical protein
MAHELTADQLEALEKLVDASTLATVLEALAEVCHEKAEHLRVNWQDSGMAVAWTRAGNRIQATANTIYNRDKV